MLEQLSSSRAAQHARACLSSGLQHGLRLSEDLQTRLLLNFFGMTVIAQLWLWPLIFLVCMQSFTVCVALATYLAWIILGPGKHAACNEAPYYAPWRSVAVWRKMADWFPASLVKTAELDPAGRYLLAAYPHGVFPVGGWCCFATEATSFSALFPGIRPYCLTLASNFKTPLVREYCLQYGLRSCARKACVQMLSGKPGVALVLYPGGAAEALVTETGKYNLILKRRKGFARIAVQTGASLVPVLGFGEPELFECFLPRPGSLMARLQQLSHRIWGTSQPMFRGTGVFTDSGLLPLRRPLTTVVGAPLAVARVDAKADPAAFDAAVEELHGRYVAALTALWDEWKDRLAPERKGELTLVG